MKINNTRKNKNKNRKLRKIKKKTAKNGAGIFSFAKEVSQNIIPKEIKPASKTDEPYNHSYETTVTPDSGKEYEFLFITPQTLLLNNVDTVRVPNFIINGEKMNIKIKNRYINYLVKCENEWYAILRITFALNTGFFASMTYTIFYKLHKDVIQFNTNHNSIKINKKHFDENKKFTLGMFRTNDSKTVILDGMAYTPITKEDGDIFYALRKFRNVQLESYNIKQEATDNVVTGTVDGIIDVGSFV
jgi:hypothetical protein